MTDDDNSLPITNRLSEDRVTQRLSDDSIIAHNEELQRITDRWLEELGGPASNENMQSLDAGIAVDVTERFEEPRITEAFTSPEIQKKRPEQSVSSSRISLMHGELLDDRYRIEMGPIGAATGEAEVFFCTDTRSDKSVAVKFYHEKVLPKKEILDVLVGMRHPNVVSLLAFGQWAGRCYEVLEFCAGGNLIDHAPYKEIQLREFLTQILAGLNYLHSLGIVHRDIKPNNLLFRDSEHQTVVIGDFGVSSILDMDEKVRKTSTGAFFTLDYAAPELIDGKEVSHKTDYYGLGVTLMHLYLGTSPFVGMDKNAILGAHFRGTIPKPTGISEEFRKLLDGLTRVSPELRWGFTQVAAWLKNELIFLDDGTPDHEDQFSGKEVPYRSAPDIKTPAMMARRLKQLDTIPFDIGKDLQRGFISQWLMFFSTDLGKRVAQLEEEFEDNPKRGVFKLRYLLDPTQPLEVGNSKVYNTAQLAALLRDTFRVYQNQLTELLYSESIEIWLQAIANDENAIRLCERISIIRKNVPDAPLGLFALQYTLEPDRPLLLSDKVELTYLDQLESILSKRSDLLRRTQYLLFNGYFEEWIRAAFPDRVNDLRFIMDCVRTYRENPELGFFAFRCRFFPAMPFRIGSMVARTPKELAAIVDRNPQLREEAIRMMYNGWIRTWLICTGRMKDPRHFDHLIADKISSHSRKLESLLHLLDPELLWPVVAADVTMVDGGLLSPDAKKTVQVYLFNAGRGYLHGSVTLASDYGFTMEPKTLENDPLTVEITMHGLGMPMGSTQQTHLIVDTNGGKLSIPLTFRISAPILSIVLRCLAAGGVIGGILGLYRLIFSIIFPEFAKTNMAAFDWGQIETLSNRLFAVIPSALFLVVVIGGSIYYTIAMSRIRE